MPQTLETNQARKHLPVILTRVASSLERPLGRQCTTRDTLMFTLGCVRNELKHHRRIPNSQADKADLFAWLENEAFLYDLDELIEILWGPADDE